MNRSALMPAALASTIFLGSLFHVVPAWGGGDGGRIFAAARTFDVAEDTFLTYSLAVGDFNGDENEDLAVPNSGGVAVFLGKGDGTFGSPITNRAVPGAAFVAGGDLNGDEKLDLAVVHSSPRKVSVLLGKGDGTFESPASYSLDGSSSSVAVADFNEDGAADMAVANLDSDSVSVLLGKGDGTFQIAGSHPAGAGAFSVAVGEFNGDNKPDLAVVNIGSAARAHADSGISILLSNGNGTFQRPVKYSLKSGPYAVDVGDFNGDGKTDLAVADYGSYPQYSDAGIAVLFGNGDGSFKAQLSFGAGNHPRFVAVADLNGDGRLDLAVVNFGGVAVLLHRPDGFFEGATDYGTGGSPRAVASGDFNRDGKLDLAVVNRNPFGGSGNVSVLLGRGDGTLEAARSYVPGASFLTVGDFNGDAKLDLLGGNRSLLLAAGDGSFSAVVNSDVGPVLSAVAEGDFNGDSKLDTAALSASDTISVRLGNGDGTFKRPRSFLAGTNCRSVIVSDFNADGKADLAVANSSGAALLLGNGDGTFKPAATRTGDYGPRGYSPLSVAGRDLNGDGKPDLLAVSGSRIVPFSGEVIESGFVWVWLGKGDGTFQGAAKYAPGSHQGSVAVDDFNGDGKPDLAVLNSGSPTGRGSVSVLLGRGEGTFSVARDYFVGVGPASLAAADFNGDGKPDLAVANTVSGDVSVLVGNGDGSFRTADSYGASAGPWSVAAGDFNNDGWPDLAVANLESANTSVLLNTFVPANVALALVREAKTLTLSWRSPTNGFVLESTASLSRATWQSITERPSLNNGRWEATAPAEGPERYFRLRKP